MNKCVSDDGDDDYYYDDDDDDIPCRVVASY